MKNIYSILALATLLSGCVSRSPLSFIPSGERNMLIAESHREREVTVETMLEDIRNQYKVEQ